MCRKLCLWLALALIGPAHGATPQICAKVSAAAQDFYHYPSQLLSLGLVTEDGKLHPEARMGLSNRQDSSITTLRRQFPDHHVRVATQFSPDGSPAFLRIQMLPSPGRSLQIEDVTPVYFYVAANQRMKPVNPPVEIYRGYFSLTPTAREPKTSQPDLASLPGRQPHGEILSISQLIADPNAVHLGTSQMILMVRRDRKSPASALAPDKLYTFGMANCAGVFLEGNGFVLGTHLVSAAVTPAEQTMKLAIQKIKEAGLSMDGVKARIIGGDHLYPEMAAALVESTRALGIPIVETDILGKQGKDFPELGRAIGYRFTDGDVPVPFDLESP